MRAWMNWRTWEAVRQKGILHFVIVRGVLGWGVWVALTSALTAWALTPHVQFGLLLKRSLVIFPIGGILWGLSVWFFTERKYALYKAKKMEE